MGSKRSKHQLIYYFCPDFPQPSGGIKTLYRHVWQLNQRGMQAAIVHQNSGFSINWHTYDAPKVYLDQRPAFGPKDICVFPEVMADTVRKTSRFPGTRIVFALSWLPSYSRLRPGERWQDHGIQHVITKSPAIQRHLAWSMDLQATLIPEFVNPRYYFVEGKGNQDTITDIPADEKVDNKAATDLPIQLCYTTRKEQSGPWLQGVLKRKGSPYEDIRWVALREMDESTYAYHLRQAQIYVVTTMQEGMHVSVLEAMACGCLVVGYSGIGGSDYMNGAGDQQNCLLVENGNLLALGQCLEETLSHFKNEPNQYQSIIDNGIATAMQYQQDEAEGKALVDFFTELQLADL